MEWAEVLKIVVNLKIKFLSLLSKKELTKCFDSTIYSIEEFKILIFWFKSSWEKP